MARLDTGLRWANNLDMKMRTAPLLAFLGSLFLLIAPNTAIAEDDLFACRAAPEKAKIEVLLKKRFTARDVALWYYATTCKPVTVARTALDQAAKGGFRRTIRVPDMGKTLVVLARRVQLVPILGVDGGVTLARRNSDGLLLLPSAIDRVVVGTNSDAPVQNKGPTNAERAALYDVHIRKKSTFSYDIDRVLWDRALRGGNMFMHQARIVPAIKHGRANGFKIYAVRPSSFVARVGIKNGDTLHRVNDMDMSTPDAALDVYKALGKAKVIKLQLTRRGRPVTLVYHIK